MGRPFIIKTDQQSLKYLLHQRIGTPLQHKWLSELLGYAFVVEYKKGSENVKADALSRRGEVTVTEVHNGQEEFEGTAALNMMRANQNDEEGDWEMAALSPTSSALYIISFPTPTWVVKRKVSYEADSTIQTVLSAFQKYGNPPKCFSLVDGYCFSRAESIWGLIVLLSLLFCTMFTMDPWVVIQAM